MIYNVTNNKLYVINYRISNYYSHHSGGTRQNTVIGADNERIKYAV